MKQYPIALRIVCRLLPLLVLTTGCGLLDSAVTPTPPSGADQVSQVEPSATATATAVPPPTDEPTETPTATQQPPSPTAVPTDTLTPSATPLPSATPSPTATATPEPLLPTRTPPVPTPPLPEWLSFMNRFREMAHLPPVTDWEPYTIGSEHHSQYMVINDAAIAHSQDPNNPLFDPAGDQAARNGNIFATSQLDANYIWSMNFWASAPFHLIGVLDPNLVKVGYGDYVEESGEVNMAAVLDIGSDTGGDNGVSYPILFPGPNSKTWVVRHSLYEWPDPVGSCPGFSRPTGAPIVLFLGDGSGTPQVEHAHLAMGDQPLETCTFDETNYRNDNEYAQKVGRTILDLNDAVVVIPRFPLAADATYTAQVTANGATYTWQFETIKRPQ